MDPNSPNNFSSSPNYSNSQSYPSFQSFLNNENYHNSQAYSNSQFSPNLNKVPIPEQVQTSQNLSRNLFRDTNRKVTWRVKEDVALMSSWVYIGEDETCGKNQKSVSFWNRVHKMYEDIRKDNPDEISERNISMMKGRYKRLNESVNKWVAAYREAYVRKRSGMSKQDIEKEAHTIYGGGNGSKFQDKFQDITVFEEVMSKHPKWAIHYDQLSEYADDIGNEESGGSSKRSRTSEDGAYSIPTNPENPHSGGSGISRPTGRDKAKKKGKGKASQSSSSSMMEEAVRAIRLSRENNSEVLKQKIELESKKLEVETLKMKHTLLMSLLPRENLSPDEEVMKRHLWTLFK